MSFFLSPHIFTPLFGSIVRNKTRTRKCCVLKSYTRNRRHCHKFNHVIIMWWHKALILYHCVIIICYCSAQSPVHQVLYAHSIIIHSITFTYLLYFPSNITNKNNPWRWIQYNKNSPIRPLLHLHHLTYQLDRSVKGYSIKDCSTICWWRAAHTKIFFYLGAVGLIF